MPRLVALDQMPSGAIEPKQVVPLLSSSNDELRQTARWLVTQHTEWGSDLAAWFRGQLATIGVADQSPASHATDSEVLESMLVSFAGNSAIQELLADVVRQPESSNAARMMALRAMAAAKLSQPPRQWREALSVVISDEGAELVPLTVNAARALPAMTTADTLHQAPYSCRRATASTGVTSLGIGRRYWRDIRAIGPAVRSAPGIAVARQLRGDAVGVRRCYFASSIVRRAAREALQSNRIGRTIGAKPTVAALCEVDR